MVGFIYYDLGFLILFTLGVVWFLYRKKKNLKREGIMYLYRTKMGMRVIDYVGGRFGKILNGIKYFVIGVGFVLMGAIVWLIGQTIYTYVKFPQIIQVIKAPPIAPLIPYFPELFGMQSFFPTFYAIYFVLAVAIVAIAHEFAHGIYMKLYNIKIKSTGFVFVWLIFTGAFMKLFGLFNKKSKNKILSGFFGILICGLIILLAYFIHRAIAVILLIPILGAFVEEDKKQLEKKKKIEQMSVLSAGVFANLIFALIFFGLLVGFFYISFAPSGYIFNSYAFSVIAAENISGFEETGNLTKVLADGGVYFLDEDLKGQLEENASRILVYDDAPAFRVGLEGAIVQIDGEKIAGQESLQEFLEAKKPGDEISVVTKIGDEEKEYTLVLGEHPLDESRGYIGIASSQPQASGIFQKVVLVFMSFKNPSTYYSPKWDGGVIYFIYNLFWWVMIINLLVALFNMLPLGFLDGGRFFYLAILGITGSEDFAKKAFKFATYLILGGFLFLMIFWLVRVL